MKITLCNISKSFLVGRKKEKAKEVLKNINVDFADGQTYFLLGPSGSGKSTLLSILGLLDSPTSGKVLFNGNEVENTQSFIEEHISFVFQEYNLFENLSVYDNLSIYETNVDKLKQYLEDFNCDFSLSTKVKYLSGGEKQRLSILRAYLKGGDIFLLDEPTGNLDLENSYKIMDMVQAMAKDKIVIVVSHDTSLAYQYADEILFLKDGTIDSIRKNKQIIQLDFVSKGKDALIELYNLVNTFKQIECVVGDEVIQLNNQNYVSICDNIYQRYKNEVVNIKLVKKENTFLNRFPEKVNGKAKFLNNFAFKNILGRKGRTIASFVVLLLSCASLFLFGNVAFYNVGAYVQDNLNEAGFAISQLNYRTSYETWSKGAVLHTISAECEGYLVNTTSSIADLKNQKNYLVDFYLTNANSIEISGVQYEINEEIYLSEPLFELGLYEESFSFENGLSLPISSTLIKLDEIAINNLEFNKYFVIASYDYYFNNYLSLIDPFNTPLTIGDTPQQLIEDVTRRKVISYNEQDVIFGRKIQNSNEIIIEKDLYEGYLASGIDLLNKTSNVLSLDEYEIANAPASSFDLSLLFKETKIVGVIENTPHKSLHIEKGCYYDLVSQLLRFSNKAALLNENSEKSYSYLYENNVFSASSQASPVYAMANAYIKQGMVVVVSLILVFLVISGLVLSIWITNVLKDRHREIAIMKCMGFTQKSIYFSFLKMILCVSIVSLISGLISGVIFTNLINNGLLSIYSHFSISYMFVVSWLSFLIPTIFSIMFPILISLIFNRKIISIAPYHALKEFK